MNPITQFSNRESIPLGGFSLDRQRCNDGDTGPTPKTLDEILEGVKRCPAPKYPPVVREDPDSWPVIWRGVWKGDESR